MTICAIGESQQFVFVTAPESPELDYRMARIAEVFGVDCYAIPPVDDATLRWYYQYLATQLSFPWTAHYPKPESAEETIEFRCRVLELLNPAKCLGDIIDGLFCKVRKGKYEFNLPLIELYLAGDAPILQPIQDFRYWLWNWR